MQNHVELMSTDELWILREKVCATLAAKMIAEKSALETRLRELNRRLSSGAVGGEICAPTLPESFAEIPKSAATVGDVVRPRQAATLARCAADVRKADG